MKPNIDLQKRFLVIATPVLASYFVAASPSQAASFAFSEGTLFTTNFSHNSVSKFTDTDSHTRVTSKGGVAVSSADANALLKSDGYNFSTSMSLGQDNNYRGLATSRSIVQGVFNVKANSLFSFNFFASLNLETSIDKHPGEKAKAAGEISFALFDLGQKRLLDKFSLTSKLLAHSNDDFISYHKKGNIVIDEIFPQSDFGNKQDFASVFLRGFVERSFSYDTSLALIAITHNEARVSAPEPATGIGLLLSGGFVSIIVKRKRPESS